MSNYSGTVDFDKGSFTVKACHNSKIQSTQLLISFNTTEHELLNELLKKFKAEKFTSIGTNLNNKVDQMVCKNSCIFVVLPEAKVLAFIYVLYQYLLTKNISSFSVKNCITKSQSYTKLHKDISKFAVYITGKCKNTCAKLGEGSAKAVVALKSNLKAAKVKDYPDIKPGSTESYFKEFEASGSDLEKLYFVIFCQQFDFYFNKNKIVASEQTKKEMEFYIKENGGMIRSVVVSFIRQCGNLATDDAVKRVNAIVEIISILHGINKVSIKSGDIDPEAVKAVKSLMK